MPATKDLTNVKTRNSAALKARLGPAKRAVIRAAQRASRTVGYELLERHFYNPLPDLDNLPARLWAGAWDLPGVDLRVDEAVRFLDEELRPHIRDFTPPYTLDASGTGGTGTFYLQNGGYESVDAESLYGILRHIKPKKVLELGSGASSHVIDFARRANEVDGSPFDHEIVDPYPFGNPMGPVADAVVRPVRGEDLDPCEVEQLEDGDVFFVDTTHTVKTGGDVAHIILNLLPRLPRGVWAHVHDVFLPYEYPREWVVKKRRAWAEQYMLQAFLAFNQTYEVMFPAQAVVRLAPDVVKDVVPSFRPGVSPGAFWMRRI